jgi:hypothetical protein
MAGQVVPAFSHATFRAFHSSSPTSSAAAAGMINHKVSTAIAIQWQHG